MFDDADGFRAPTFDELTRSDRLPAAIELIEPFLRQFGAAGVRLRIRVVLDTSTVISELVWLVSRRKTAGARTSLAEAISAQVVIACAPPQIDDEIRSNLDDLARQTRATREEIWGAWLEYRRLITIVDPDPITTSATSYLVRRDSSDLAFLQLSETIAASAVLSGDRDLRDADSRVIPAADISIDLRNYARAKTISLTVFGLTTFSVTIGLNAGVAALRDLPTLARALSALPRWMHVTIIGLLIWTLSKKDGRQAFVNLVNRTRGWFGDAAEALKGPMMDLLSKAGEAHDEATQAQRRIELKARPRRLLLRQALHLALAQANSALGPSDLEAAVLRLGYASTAKTLVGPIVRSLRGDARFVEINGCWTLRVADEIPLSLPGSSLVQSYRELRAVQGA